MSTTDLTTTPVDPIAALTEKPYIDQINARALAVFKAKCKGVNDIEAAMALELARSLGLNPWANEFYAAKSERGQLLIMVGRDGLLRKAEEFPDYLGYDAGVVYEDDDFAFTEPDPDGKTLRERAGIRHSSDPTTGVVKGAWAAAERRGRPPRRFYARLEEYMPTNQKKVQYSPWGSAVSVMIEKVPISVVHRTLCNLSGVYLQEEADRILEAGSGDGGLTREDETRAVADLVGNLEGGAELHEGLLRAIERMNELSPGAWGLAKCQMTLPGRTVEELEKQLAQIEADVAAEEEQAGYVTAEVVEEKPGEPEPPEAEVVDAEPEADLETPPGDRIEGDEDGHPIGEGAEELESRIADIEAALEDPDVTAEQADGYRAEAASLREQLDASQP